MPEIIIELDIIPDSFPGQHCAKSVVVGIHVKLGNFWEISENLSVYLRKGPQISTAQSRFWFDHKKSSSFRQSSNPLSRITKINGSGNHCRYTAELLDSNITLEFKNRWPEDYKETISSNQSEGRKYLKKAKLYCVPSFFVFEFRSLHPLLVIARQHIDGLTCHNFSLLRT